jgi:hypothetical protein
MNDRRSQEAMSIARLQAILDAYGAAPRRWPAAERAAAEALLAASGEARALRDRAAALDRALEGPEAPQPSSALRAAILQAAPMRTGAAEAPSLWRWLLGVFTGELGGLRPAGAVLGVALLLGVAAGGAVETGTTGTLTADAPEQALDFVQLALFDDSYGEF